MYIRRKVFSLLQDETGEERYFSTTDITLEDAEQRIFSLVEDEEEQREYAKKEGLTAGQKAAIGTAAGLAATAGGIYGAKAIGKEVVKSALKNRKKLVSEASSTFKEMTEEQMDKLAQKVAKQLKVGKALQKPADAINEYAKGVADKVKNIGKKADKNKK